MAKKKSKPPKKGPKRSTGSGPEFESLPEGFDRRAIEGVMKEFLGGLFGPGEETPLRKAQEIVYKAFDSPDEKERIKLAQKALDLSPDCADALVLLAELAKSRKEALEFYEQAVAAGERALGPEIFEQQAGNFWALLETRPYMRAREGLANVLWTMGRREEAISHLQDMLRLNPNDNQGLRYALAGWLLSEERDDELGPLLAQFEEGSASWVYTKALYAFRRHGDTPEARDLLKKAKKTNKHIPDYLIGREMIPSQQPAHYTLGSEEEAIIYAATFLSGWKTTAGAIAWLKDVEHGSKKKKKPTAPKTEGPLPLAKKRLERLAQEFDVWQADFRQFGPRVEEEGELLHPWLSLVTSRVNGVVLAQTIALDPPSADVLWDLLAEAIRRPMMEKPHRPTELQVRPDERWDALKPHLAEIGVNLVPMEELDQIDFLFNELKEGLAADQPPGLLEMPGVTADQLAGFYGAAAEFYRKAPWRKLGFEAAIKVECGKFESSPWYAIVMGQSGMTLGLALYDDFKILEALWSGTMSDEENARETVALSLTFDDESEIPDADLDAIEEHDFEVAGSEAYPSIFRKERGMTMRPPLAWELELMEGCLRAIPAFVASHKPDDRATYKTIVPAAGGEIDITLSWVGD